MIKDESSLVQHAWTLLSSSADDEGEGEDEDEDEDSVISFSIHPHFLCCEPDIKHVDDVAGQGAAGRSVRLEECAASPALPRPAPPSSRSKRKRAPSS